MKCPPVTTRASFRGARRGAVIAFSTAALAFSLTGCDQEAANRGEAARLLQEGVAAMREADTATPTDDQTLSAARLGKLQAAVSPLSEAASKGSSSQALQANILLARIDAQAGEAQARAAAAGASDSRLTLASLLSELDTIDTLGSTALTAERDPAQAIETIEAEIAKVEAKRDERSTQVARLQARVDDLNAQIEDAAGASREAFAEKSALETEAFVQEGEAKYATLSAATKAQRRADTSDVQAQALGNDRDAVAADLALAQRELELAEASLDQFLDTRDAFAQAGEDAADTVRAFRVQQAERAEALAAKLEEAVNAFDGAVTGPITEAANRAQSAVDRLQRGGSGLSGAERNQQRAELLDKLHLQTQTLADAARYHADLRASLGAIAARPSFEPAPELREKIDGLAAELAGAGDAFRDRATAALTATQEALEQADPEDGRTEGVRAAVARLSSELNAG